MELQDHQWIALEGLFKIPSNKRGKRQKNMKGVLNGIFWVCRTGEPWASIPHRFAPSSSCYKCYHDLLRSGKYDTMLWILALQLHEVNIDILSLFENARYNPHADKTAFYAYLCEQSKIGGWEYFTLQLFINPYMESGPKRIASLPEEKEAVRMPMR